MPGKSRHGRGKYSPPVKKKKGRSSRPSTHTPATAITQTHKPPSSPDVSVSPPGVPAPMARPAAIRHPYIATELRTIGILAVIMLIVLAALAAVLS